jgi:predicted DNA-binding transcriptional regulator AlpA
MQQSDLRIQAATGDSPILPPGTSRVISKRQLWMWIGHGLSWMSFQNWLWKATTLRGFPRPILLGAERGVCWVEHEVAMWLAARPRSSADQSPRRRKRSAA